jgi:hypothetical protein
MSAIHGALASWLSTEKNDWPTIFNVSCSMTQVIGIKYVAQ